MPGRDRLLGLRAGSHRQNAMGKKKRGLFWIHIVSAYTSLVYIPDGLPSIDMFPIHHPPHHPSHHTTLFLQAYPLKLSPAAALSAIMHVYSYLPVVALALITAVSAQNDIQDVTNNGVAYGALNSIQAEAAPAKRSVDLVAHGTSIQRSVLKRTLPSGICTNLPSRWSYLGW